MLALALCLTACGPRPTAVVARYLAAANRGDVNAMLDCLEPDASSVIQGMADIAGSQFGIDAGAVFDMAPGLMSVANAYGAGYGVDYRILNETIDRNRAVVTIDYAMSAGDTKQAAENAEVPLVKIDGRWYISMY